MNRFHSRIRKKKKKSPQITRMFVLRLQDDRCRGFIMHIKHRYLHSGIVNELAKLQSRDILEETQRRDTIYIDRRCHLAPHCIPQQNTHKYVGYLLLTVLSNTRLPFHFAGAARIGVVIGDRS